MPKSTRHAYELLRDNQIRILVLLPGEFDDCINVQLSVVELRPEIVVSGLSGSPPSISSDSLEVPYVPHSSDGRQFEALSYAWGSKSSPQLIEFEDGGYLEITRSLYHALKYLRLVGGERRIWVDAVCINQADLDERAAQVAIMSTIFRSATRVLVWLGEAEPSDALAFAMLYASDIFDLDRVEVLDATAENESAEVEVLPDDLKQEILERAPWCPCCNIRFGSGRHDLEEGFIAVDALRNRDWFHRLWVYQKAACAKSVEVHCGSHHCNWESIEGFLNPLYASLNPSNFEIVSICRTMGSRSFDPSALLRLLVPLGPKSCDELQDRIFAIRSMAGLEKFESLKPNYTLPSAEVYKRVIVESLCTETTSWLARDRATPFLNIDLIPGLPFPHVSLFLALAGLDWEPWRRIAETKGQPSWVPSLDQLHDRAFAKYYEYSWHLGPRFLGCEQRPDWTDNRKYPKSPDLRIQFVPSMPNVLQMNGFHLARVSGVLDRSESPYAHTFQKWHHDFPNNMIVHAFYRWILRCKEFIDRNCTISIHAFKKLMYCNSLCSGFDADLYRLFMEGGPETCTGRNCLSCLHWVAREFVGDLRVDKFRKMRYYDDFRNLSFVNKPDGNVLPGWIPSSAEEGDAIYIFRGCPRPFVLRQQDNGHYALLGDSWVLGIADDISFDIPESEMEWISLC